MSTPTIIRVFDLSEEFDRGLFVSSDKKKLWFTGKLPRRIQLIKDGNGEYPTTADIWIRTDSIEASAVTKWIGFHPDKNEKSGETLIQYRLYDGVQDRYWNGASWAVAGVSNWNTLQVIQDNITSFPVTNGKIAVVFNLSTTKKKVTPFVTGLAIGYEVRIESFVEDMVFDTLIPNLRTGVQVRHDEVVKWGGGTQLDLDTVKFDIDYDIIGMDSAFNYDTDPNLRTSLLQSYDVGTKVLTLTQSVTANVNVLIRLILKPLVAFHTHPDYNEIAKVPAIVLRSVREDQLRDTRQKLYVGNFTSLAATAVQAPRQSVLEIPFDLYTHRLRTGGRLHETTLQYLRRNPIITSPRTDLSARLDITEDMGFFPRGDDDTVQRSTLTVELRSLESWIFPAESAKLVKTLVTTTGQQVQE